MENGGFALDSCHTLLLRVTTQSDGAYHQVGGSRQMEEQFQQDFHDLILTYNDPLLLIEWLNYIPNTIDLQYHLLHPLKSQSAREYKQNHRLLF